jgi:hypothetical protein
VTTWRGMEGNGRRDLRKQDVCQQNLANLRKGLVLVFLHSTYWDWDLQRRSIDQWKECCSRYLRLFVVWFVSISLSLILQRVLNDATFTLG